MWASQFVPSGAGLQPGYTVSNNVLTNASVRAGGRQHHPVRRVRPDLASGRLVQHRTTSPSTPTGAPPTTSASRARSAPPDGKGDSPTQDVIELGTAAGAGASWGMNGTGKPTNWSLGGDNSSPSGILPSAGWIFGGQGIKREGQGELGPGRRRAGLRRRRARLAAVRRALRRPHAREPVRGGAGPGLRQRLAEPGRLSDRPPELSGDFAARWAAASRATSGTTRLASWRRSTTSSPTATRSAASTSTTSTRCNEKDTAAYVQLNFQAGIASGNLGVRYVKTKENIGYTSTAPDAEATSVHRPDHRLGLRRLLLEHLQAQLRQVPAQRQPEVRPQTTSGWLRFAASQTMTRPDYSALAGSVSADDLTHTGSGGNPKLQAADLDQLRCIAGVVLRPARPALGQRVCMNLKDYVNFGNEVRTFKDLQASPTRPGQDVYTDLPVSVPTNVNGQVRGLELNYIQPIGENFGVQANYTYARRPCHRRRAAAGHLEEHLQRVGLLRERSVQRPCELHLPLVVLRRREPHRHVLPGRASATWRCRWATRSTTTCDLARRDEPQQPQAEVLHAERCLRQAAVLRSTSTAGSTTLNLRFKF